jgi:uncharacterized phiE125 gp8 family phage protein
MMATVLEVIPPASELVSVEDARAQCRIPQIAEADAEVDALLERYIRAARQYVEWRTGRTLLRTRLKAIFDCWPHDMRLTLPRATPLSEVISATWYGADGSEHSFLDIVTADAGALPGALILRSGETWPGDPLRASSPIVVVYDAGLEADVSPEPGIFDAARHAILLLVGAMYENREAETVTNLATVEGTAFRYGLEAFLSLMSIEYAIR